MQVITMSTLNALQHVINISATGSSVAAGKQYKLSYTEILMHTIGSVKELLFFGDKNLQIFWYKLIRGGYQRPWWGYRLKNIASPATMPAPTAVYRSAWPRTSAKCSCCPSWSRFRLKNSIKPSCAFLNIHGKRTNRRRNRWKMSYRQSHLQDTIYKHHP